MVTRKSTAETLSQDMVNIITLINDKFLSSDKMLKIQLESIQFQLKSINEKVDKSDKAIDGINVTINNMILSETKHYLDCPNTKDIKTMQTKIDNDNKPRDLQLNEIAFIIKYWKVFALAYVIFMILTVGGIIGVYKTSEKQDALIENNLANIQKNTQRLNYKDNPNSFENVNKK